LLAGELRYCLQSASSAEASLRGAFAAPRGIFVRCRFPMAGRAVRAVDSRFPMPQFFAVAALVIQMSGAAHASAFFCAVVGRRPPAPIGWGGRTGPRDL